MDELKVIPVIKNVPRDVFYPIRTFAGKFITGLQCYIILYVVTRPTWKENAHQQSNHESDEETHSTVPQEGQTIQRQSFITV